MNSLFEDLKTGLQEAIDYEKGLGKAKVRVLRFEPVRKIDNKEIRKIRLESGMTQAAFAQFMGISLKTVEAWECGRIHPTGPAYRLLGLLD
ncbi:MAG: helix-turn-helix domain-containing protein, partial [Spirochaetales bacterium]|nr:helix-turn-helix domain-containing protein [Spirochaetales bacterium]